MKATIIGMLVCVVAAAVVMVAVALPRLRQGARVLTPTGREQVTDARRRAMALAAQAKERASLVAEQARERAAGEQDDVGGQVDPAIPVSPVSPVRVDLEEPSPAAVPVSPAAEQWAGGPTAPPSANPAREPVRAGQVSAADQPVVDVRAAAGGAETEVGKTRTLPAAAVPRPAPGERVRPVAGVIPGVSPRAPHRMSSWNPTSTGPRHAR